MSLPPHREVNAKVEGRDPPERVEDTIGPFRSLATKLLRVPMNEVKEQQQIYDERPPYRFDAKNGEKVKRKRDLPPTPRSRPHASQNNTPDSKE